MAIPGLVLSFSVFMKNRIVKVFLNIYFAIFLFLCSLIVLADLELYRNWGFRIDSTPLLYLKTPSEAFASAENKTILLFSLALIAFFLTTKFVYSKYISPIIKKFSPQHFLFVLFYLFITASLIIPIRGGVGIAPLNVGSVYFHNQQFPNHAAVNPVWNFGHDLSKMNKKMPNPEFMKKEEAETIFDSLFPKNDTSPLFLKKKANVLIIILESFSGKIMEELSGLSGITPNLSKLIHEGIFFKNLYANGDRSDKGLVAILSSYPAQTTTSIIKRTKKTQTLPYLSKKMKKQGYKTSFYYGGDLNFANMRAYLTNGEFERFVTKDDFDSDTYNSKWGAHDHVVFNRLTEDLKNNAHAFFSVIFTLSSHEPFEVPMETKIQGDDEEAKFLNSAYYTDRCLGNFIENAKKETWWENTLVVITADHGSRHPGNSPVYVNEKFHIPMLWLGGALTKTDTVITNYCSQTDIAPSILQQLKIPADEFKFGKNIFAKNQPSFAFYAFNNGFSFINDSTNIIYDLTSKKYLLKQHANPLDLKSGKAFLQILISDFNER